VWELLGLFLLGIVMIWLGNYCLLQYKISFFNNPNLTVTWDLLVQALGAGTSWGRLGVTLLMVGVFFCVMVVFAVLGLLFHLL